MTERSNLTRFIEHVTAGGDPRAVAYSTDLFATLEGSDRVQAVTMLLERGRRGDVRAIETLGLARVGECTPGLMELMGVEGEVGAAAARALMTIRRLQRRKPTTVELQRITEGATAPETGLGAAMNAYALRSADGTVARDGLVAALASPDSAARSNAVLGLCEKHGLEAFAHPRQGPVWRLVMRISSEYVTLWQPAAEQLQGELRRWYAGASPEELGWIYVSGSDPADVQAFWESRPPEYDKALYGKLSGQDRQWADAWMLSKLSRRPKSAVHLAEMGVPGLEATLKEAADRAYGNRKAAFEAGLAALRSA